MRRVCTCAACKQIAQYGRTVEVCVLLIHNIYYTHAKRSQFPITLYCYNNIMCMNKELAHLDILHFMRPSGFDTC